MKVARGMSQLLLVVISVLSSANFVLYSKDLMSLGFIFATTLASWHLLLAFCSLHVALCLNVFEHKPIDARTVMGFGVLKGISNGLLNLSLGFNSYRFYQMTKLATIPCTVILETLFFRKKFSRYIQLSLSVLLFGVGVATVTDQRLNAMGSVLSLLAIITTSIAQIMTITIQKKFKVSSTQLLYQSCPYQALTLFIVGPFLDGFLTNKNVFAFEYTPKVLYFIVVSCLSSSAMVIVNTCYVIGKTSAVTYLVVVHLMTCLVLDLSFFLICGWLCWRNILGVLIAVVGLGLYFYISTRETQQKPTELSPLKALFGALSLVKLGTFSPEEQMDAHQIPSHKEPVSDTISEFEKREGDSSMDLESPVPLPNRVKLLYKGHQILNVIFGILIGSIAGLRWYTSRAEFGRTAILICLVGSNMLVLVSSRYCFFRNGRSAGLEAYIFTGAMVLDDYVALLMINIEYIRIVMIPCVILFLIGTLGWKLRNSGTVEILSVEKTNSSDKLELFEFVSYLLQLSLVTWIQYKGQQGCSPVLSDFLLFLCSVLGALGVMLASPLAGVNSRAVSVEVLPVLHKTCTVVLFIAVHTLAAEWLGEDMIYVCLPELITVLAWFTICFGESMSVSSFTLHKSKPIIESSVVAILAFLISCNVNDRNMRVSRIIWLFWISASSSALCQFHVWLLHGWPGSSSESNKLIRLLNVASRTGSGAAAILCFYMIVTDPRILYEAISSFQHKAIAAVGPIVFLLTFLVWSGRRRHGHSETQIQRSPAGRKHFIRGDLSHMLDIEKVATPSVSKYEETYKNLEHKSYEILEKEEQYRNPEQESVEIPEKENPDEYFLLFLLLGII